MADISLIDRKDIISALRRGTVPARGLENFAVGLERFGGAIDDELDLVKRGGGGVKAVRGEYGCGKTFFARWVQHRARRRGFVTAEVQINETETPLYRMETIYRRAVQSLQTDTSADGGAFRSIIDKWFASLEDEVLAAGAVREDDATGLTAAVGDLLNKRLTKVSAIQPLFAVVLRAIHRARFASDNATEEGLFGWLMGQPNVAAATKNKAGIKGDLDHAGAAGFLRGLLEIVRMTGRAGMVLVLDEIETIQRMRRDARERSLNALRQLLDDLDKGAFPGLYVLITGTPAFFDGPKGMKALEPLRQRLHYEFGEFESTTAVQIRLPAFDFDRLIQVGRHIRSLHPSSRQPGMDQRVTDDVIAALARDVAGKLGGKVGVAPRIFLKKLVDVIDLAEQHEAFDPAVHYKLSIDRAELKPDEQLAAGIIATVDDIALDLSRRSEDDDA